MNTGKVLSYRAAARHMSMAHGTLYTRMQRGLCPPFDGQYTGRLGRVYDGWKIETVERMARELERPRKKSKNGTVNVYESREFNELAVAFVTGAFDRIAEREAQLMRINAARERGLQRRKRLRVANEY